MFSVFFPKTDVIIGPYSNVRFAPSDILIEAKLLRYAQRQRVGEEGSREVEEGFFLSFSPK